MVFSENSDNMGTYEDTYVGSEKKLNIAGIIVLFIVYAITVTFNSLAGALGGSKSKISVVFCT